MRDLRHILRDQLGARYDVARDRVCELGVIFVVFLLHEQVDGPVVIVAESQVIGLLDQSPAGGQLRFLLLDPLPQGGLLRGLPPVLPVYGQTGQNAGSRKDENRDHDQAFDQAHPALFLPVFSVFLYLIIIHMLTPFLRVAGVFHFVKKYKEGAVL